jgi:hypothetical protein
LCEADIRGYFNHIQHEWLQKMVAHRIADPLILRLIGKWLNAGFMAGGVVTRTEEGSPQGGPISPILSNIYLHYVLDLWFKKEDQTDMPRGGVPDEVCRRLRGELPIPARCGRPFPKGTRSLWAVVGVVVRRGFGKWNSARG